MEGTGSCATSAVPFPEVSTAGIRSEQERLSPCLSRSPLTGPAADRHPGDRLDSTPEALAERDARADYGGDRGRRTTRWRTTCTATSQDGRQAAQTAQGFEGLGADPPSVAALRFHRARPLPPIVWSGPLGPLLARPHRHPGPGGTPSPWREPSSSTSRIRPRTSRRTISEKREGKDDCDCFAWRLPGMPSGDDGDEAPLFMEAPGRRDLVPRLDARAGSSMRIVEDRRRARPCCRVARRCRETA